jgi:hypothetical protein
VLKGEHAWLEAGIVGMLPDEGVDGIDGVEGIEGKGRGDRAAALVGQ